ncbi:hypothetical protein CALCODRAFT_225811 [Calocera cornea HHB12733]|uniref:Uncharacterized protein n=1 Tax=Calocera cornea HHB12733 TaxID=1353952 RepID=A0A165C0T6_9BASI|nr:hypothetical protein CALCODRAFT_225811 [Calocera cornea HHB12733]
MDQPLEELKEFVICTKEENAEKPLEWQTLRTLRKAHVENEVCLRRRPVADATVSLLQAEAAGTDALFKALVSHPGPGEHCPSAREAFLKERDCVRARRVETVSRLGKALGSRLPLPDVAAEWAAVTRPGRARLVDHSVQEIARDGRGGEDDEEEGEDEGPDPSRLGAAYALASSGWPSLRAPDGQSAISSIQVNSAWLHPAFPERVEHVTYIPTTEIRSLVLRLQGRAEPFLVPVHARNMVWVEAALSWLVEGAVLADMVAPQERGAEPWCHKHPSAVSTTVGVISLVDPAGPPLPADVRSRFEAGPVVLTHGLAREQDVLEVALAGSTILTVFDQALADNGPAPSSQKAITCLSELEERAKHDRKKAFLYTWDVPSGDLELQAASQLRSLSMDAVAWAATRHIAERDGTMGGSSLARPRMRRLLLLTPGAIVGHDAGGLCAPHGACLHLTVLRGSLLLFFSLGGAAELAAGHGERRGGQYAWKELLPGDEAYFPPGTLLTAVAGGGRPEEQAAAETAEMAVAEFGYFFSPLHLYNTVLTKAVLSGRDLATFPAEEACPAVEEALLLYVWKEVHWRREALEGRENSLMKLNRPAFEARFGNKHTFPADLIGLASLVYMNTISPAQLAPMGLSDAGVTSLVASWNMRRVACTNDLIVMCFGSYVDFYKYWAPRFLGPNMTLLRLHIEGDLGPTGDRGSSRQAKEAAGSETEAGQEFEAMANMLRLKLQKYERPGLEACMTGTLRGRADPPGGEPAQTRVPTGVGLKTPASQRGAGVMSVGGDTDLGLPSPPQTDRREGGEGVGRTASTGPATSNLSGSTAMTSRKRPRDLDPHSPTAQLDEARKRRKNVAEQHTAVSVRVR